MKRQRPPPTQPAPIRMLSPRVFAVLGKPCPYCTNRMVGKQQRRGDLPTRDHINPRIKGGGPIIMSCQKCNGDKSGLTLPEWHAILTLRGDFRARIVGKLIADLDSGVVALRHIDLGIGPGVFA